MLLYEIKKMVGSGNWELLRKLDTWDAFTFQETVDALAKKGEIIVPMLIQALRDNDYHIRKGAAIALGKIKDERAIEGLINAHRIGLLPTDVVVEPLISIGSRSVPALIEMLEYDNDRAFIIHNTLGKIKAPIAVPALIKALKAKKFDYYLRNTYSAVDALISMGLPAITELIKELENKDEELNQKIISIISEMIFNCESLDQLDWIRTELKQATKDRATKEKRVSVAALLQEVNRITGIHLSDVNSLRLEEKKFPGVLLKAQGARQYRKVMSYQF